MAFPTPEQRKAIFAPSGTLVSAAAGSGKTAVLVERVVNLLIGENPIDADRLLVVTFTEAAAKEMRMRIEARINEECRKYPENHFFIKQRLQLRNAKICTIDSFCIELVRENFDRLCINPDFQIADQGSIDLLSEAALNEVINEYFENPTDEFLKLLNLVTNDNDEYFLKCYIKELYDYSQNMPFPEYWIEQQLKKCVTAENISESVDLIYGIIDKKISDALAKLQIALKSLTQYPEIFEKYKDVYMQGIADVELIKDVATARDWNKLRILVNGFGYERLPTVKGAKDISVVISAKKLKDDAKHLINSLGDYLYDNYDVICNDLALSFELTETLCEITLKFLKCFEDKRREKNIMTFYDTEHLALSLLCEINNGEITRKSDAEGIINRFDEVLVDEFQDTNNMQDLLFSVLADDEEKLFVVGDIKQSIYRFRGANPLNFSNKKDRYIPIDDAGENELKKVILGNNFRSRKGVCDFVNFFFDIMLNGDKSVIKYDRDDHLLCSADFPEKDDNDVEISFVDIEDNDTYEADAKNIAEFIHRFMREEMVIDKQSKQPRKPVFSDFTILLRDISKRGALYAKVLNSYGVPASYRLNDFLSCGEIQMILSLLKIIENPTRDIELAACLLSPVFLFTPDDVAQIRLMSKNGSLISALTAKAGIGDKKCDDFLKKLLRYSSVASNSSISDLIGYLYEDTGILNTVSVLSSGQARKSNLLTLLSLAVSYEGTNYSRNISYFIEYVENLSQKAIKPAGQNAGDNAVNIMTIHSSKGLQFPVCIIANTGATFNNADIADRILITDNDVSFKLRRDTDGKDISTVRRFAVANNIREEQIAEELRLLYVAMTRAEEKLFISAAVKDPLKKFTELSSYLSSAGSVEEYIDCIGYTSSYASLLISALIIHKNALSIRQKCDISGDFKDSLTDITLTVKNVSDINLEPISEDENIISDEIDYDLSKEIVRAIAYEYPYEQLKNIESKASVTQVAHKAEAKDFSFSSKPAFMLKSGMTPAQRGTATHRFMQFADFDGAKADIRAEIERLYEWEFITYKESQAIDVETVSRFFESKLFNRIKNADRVEREMRFLTEISAGELNSTLDSELRDEKIVVQGSVDCVFIENGELIVVDFKTDRINSSNDLNEAYAEQLSIYAKACQKIFGMPIKEKIIYSFALGTEIVL